jgi:hypothetical protein
VGLVLRSGEIGSVVRAVLAGPGCDDGGCKRLRSRQRGRPPPRGILMRHSGPPFQLRPPGLRYTRRAADHRSARCSRYASTVDLIRALDQPLLHQPEVIARRRVSRSSQSGDRALIDQARGEKRVRSPVAACWNSSNLPRVSVSDLDDASFRAPIELVRRAVTRQPLQGWRLTATVSLKDPPRRGGKLCGPRFGGREAAMCHLSTSRLSRPIVQPTERQVRL